MSDPADGLQPQMPSADRATRVRWIVLAFLCALSAILYIDRICFSKAVTSIEEELHISKENISYVMIAFTIAYGVFEIPVGRWGDRTGPRRVLPRIAICWSAFTALTGACTGFSQLLLVRFLFGMGEAGAYPNTARVLSRWFPDAERARAQGLLLASSQIGLIVAMPLAAGVIELWGWRWMFVAFGLLGVLWAAAFFLWFRDDPAAHPAINDAELQHIGQTRATAVSRHDPIPWRLVRTNFSIWVLCGTMICGAFNSYFYFSWFPRYLEQARGVANLDAGWLSSMLYLGGSLGMLASGWLTGRVFRGSEHRDAGIRALGGLSFVFAAVALWLAARSNSPHTLVLLAAVSYACAMCTQPLFWSCAITISGRHVGALFGLMNMAGGIGAALSQYFVGHYIGYRERLGYEGRELWDPVFSVYVAMLFLGGVCWSFYRTRPVEPDPVGHESV